MFLDIPYEAWIASSASFFVLAMLIAWLVSDSSEAAARRWIWFALIFTPTWPFWLTAAILSLPLVAVWWGVCFLVRRTFPLLRPRGSKPLLTLWRESRDRKRPCAHKDCTYHRNHDSVHSFQHVHRSYDTSKWRV